MKQAVYEYDFREAFKIRPDNFSYDGLGALWEYLTDLEEDTGVEPGLDVIGLCCEFSEYSCLEEFQQDYGEEYQSIEDILDRTIVIEIPGQGFIIQDF